MSVPTSVSRNLFIVKRLWFRDGKPVYPRNLQHQRIQPNKVGGSTDMR
jgi:hypothetical protein